MNKHKALNAWLSDFAPAYAAGSVPEDAELPYITYEAAWGMFGDKAAIPVTIWCGTASEAKANEIAATIENAVGMGGDVVKCDEGSLWVTPGIPFIRSSANLGPGMKARYVNLEIETLTI